MPAQASDHCLESMVERHLPFLSGVAAAAILASLLWTHEQQLPCVCLGGGHGLTSHHITAPCSCHCPDTVPMHTS